MICRSGDRSLAQVPLWSAERPALHDVVLASETDQIADRIDSRIIKTRGTDILLNDRPVFLRGICIHEENPLRGGRAYSVEDARVADELGLMVWEEIRSIGPSSGKTRTPCTLHHAVAGRAKEQKGAGTPASDFGKPACVWSD